MKKLSVFYNFNFLLDENVSKNLYSILKSKGFKVQTIQQINKSGIKNRELLNLVKNSNKTLITYDKDFLNLKVKPKNGLIVVDIHPLIDENVIPAFENFLNSFSLSNLQEMIIIIRKKDFEIK